jgi:Fe-S-cluster-containing dehydrogenase component
MNNDEDLFERLDNCSVDLFSAKKMSRNPACVRNCTFAMPIREEYDDDEEKEKEEEVDNVGDHAMRTHQMLASDDSPYANAAELTFMREVSS